ncbi:MAG: tetratricopeptide repeat protein [Armatimonadetes bacterium]|nr:tetratricopeptide repeat protein [Armatimonadota bacterium]
MGDQPGSDRASRLSLALKALDDGHIGQAVQLLQFATTVDPGNAEAHFHLGRAHLLRENLPQAETCFRRAVALDPAGLPARCALGRVLFRRGSYEEARPVLEEALRQDPQCDEARETLDLLPRPEDRELLARSAAEDLPLAALLPSRPVGLPNPMRRLLAIGGVAVAVVSSLYLLQAFVRIRTLVPGSPERVIESARPLERTLTVDVGAPGEQPGETSPAPPASATDESAAPAAAESVPGARGAEDLLARVYGAQNRFRAAHGRYGSLRELQRSGLMAADVFAGPPQARYSHALLSDAPATTDTFRVTATLPDGRAMTVDESGRISQP